MRLTAELAQRCVRPTLASHCFNYEHPRLVSHQHLFAACAAPLARQLAPSVRRLVDRAFHDARSASVGSPGFATTACFFRALPCEPNLWHSCRFRSSAFRSFGFERFQLESPRLCPSVVRDDRPRTATVSTFPRQGTFAHPRESLPISRSGFMSPPPRSGSRFPFTRSPVPRFWLRVRLLLARFPATPTSCSR